MNLIGMAIFNSKAWEEITYVELDSLGRKLTRVHAVFGYEGDLVGEGVVDYLMAYSPDGTGSFVGLECITGKIGEKAGSFVTQHTGNFNPSTVSTHWEFVPGLGMEGLIGLVGRGELKLEGPGPYHFSFEYGFDR
jgi:hypothetical protein